jgi:hypothetical protein
MHRCAAVWSEFRARQTPLQVIFDDQHGKEVAHNPSTLNVVKKGAEKKVRSRWRLRQPHGAEKSHRRSASTGCAWQFSQMGCSQARTQETAAQLIVWGQYKALTVDLHFGRRRTIRSQSPGPSARSRRRRTRAMQKRGRRRKETRSDGP